MCSLDGLIRLIKQARGYIMGYNNIIASIARQQSYSHRLHFEDKLLSQNLQSG